MNEIKVQLYKERVLEDRLLSQKARVARDETGLVKRAMTGDADAFGELYLHYMDAIYRYVYFRIGDSTDAEDLTEQVFLKAWEALPEYQDFGHPFSSWLYKIAHNMVVDYHRRQRPSLPMEHAGYEEWDHGQTGLLGQIIESEEAECLASAISRLPDEQQQVLILRFVEGLNHSEIARIMEKSDGACRMIQYRALAALSHLLEGIKG